MNENTKEMVRNWLNMHNGDKEGLARWLRDTLRIGSIKECRKIIEESTK